MTAKPPTKHQMRSVSADLINGARSADGYPHLVDRGAEPAVVMAAAAALVRAAAERTDAGAAHILSEARKALVWGRENGTTTALEANVGVTVLQLADPRREDIGEIYLRAQAWSEARGLLDSLDVIAAGVGLLQFIFTLAPNADAIADDLVLTLMEDAEKEKEPQ